MESNSVDHADIGLDRSNINHHGQIQLVNQDLPTTSHPHPSSPTAPSHSQSSHQHRSIRDSFDDRRHVTAIKLRKALHISKPSDDQSNLTSSILAHDTTEPSESRMDHDLPEPEKRTVKEMLHNPVETVKDKVLGQGGHEVAANIAAKEISHGQEVDLVNAHDRVKHAGTEDEKVEAEEDVNRIIKERQTMYVRWTVDRHVTKCRILPRETFVKKDRSAFETHSAQGGTVIDWHAYGSHVSSFGYLFVSICADTFQQLQYYAQQYGGQYIGYGSDPPAPSKESIMPNVERVIIASAPFQEFIMTTRRVYRWESPAETSKYLIVYVLLWWFNLLLPGMVRIRMFVHCFRALMVSRFRSLCIW